MKYGIRYQSATGDHVWTSALLSAECIGKWVAFTPSDDGLAMGDTREEAIDQLRCLCGAEWDDSEIDPPAMEVNEDSILTGQVEAIEEDEP
jgi:hypothetical protein